MNINKTPAWQAEEAKQRKENQDALNHPRVGDQWTEHCGGVGVILAVIFNRYVIIALQDRKETVSCLSLAEYRKMYSYDSMPDKTWADVIRPSLEIPTRFSPTRLAGFLYKRWKIKAKALVPKVELKAFGWRLVRDK